MDKEGLNEEELEEVEDLTRDDAGELTEDEILELTEEEGEETTGGAAGYGNVQFKCQCGKNFISDYGWAAHCIKTKHNRCTTYQQMLKGKNSPGKRLGAVNGTYITIKKTFEGNKVTITYPNRKTNWFWCNP